MSHSTTITKIANYFETLLDNETNNLADKLRSGDLYGFEQDTARLMGMVYNKLSETMIGASAAEINGQLVAGARAEGCRKMTTRQLSFRISTGHKISIASSYIKKPPKGWEGPRHTLARHWRILGGASPGLYDKVGFHAALGPSYEMAQQAMSKGGANLCASSVRDITNSLADFCHYKLLRMGRSGFGTT